MNTCLIDKKELVNIFAYGYRGIAMICVERS